MRGRDEASEIPESTVATARPSVMVVPAKTVSPLRFADTPLSPVSDASETITRAPSSSVASTGQSIPALTRTLSPGISKFASTRTQQPSTCFHTVAWGDFSICLSKPRFASFS